MMTDKTQQSEGLPLDLGESADAKLDVNVLTDDSLADVNLCAATDGPVETALHVPISVGDGLDLGDPTGLLDAVDCVDPGETITKLLSITDGVTGITDGVVGDSPLLAVDVNGPVDTGLVVGDGCPDDALINAEVNLPDAAGLVPDVGSLPSLPTDVGDLPTIGCLDGVLDGLDISL